MHRIFIVLLALLSSACVSSMTQDLADNLSASMQNQNDPQTVKAAAPAYLVLIDSLIEGDPESVPILLSGAKLYGSYTSAFVEDEQRAKRLADKSFDYASRALCLELEDLCYSRDLKLDLFVTALAEIDGDELPLIYAYGSAWAGWIQQRTDDWNALAQIPKLKALFNRSLELNESHENGGAYLYLAVLNSQIPASLGGKPETGRVQFEKADAMSKGQNLMVKVLFAEYYARLVFDQQLHDRLLKSVLASSIEAPGLVLVNSLAKKRAQQLLDESPEFF